MRSDNAASSQAQGPAPRFRPFRIKRPPVEAPRKIVEQKRRAKKQFARRKQRAIEEKRRERVRFNIRVARAVAMVARSRCTTRHACRCVGLKVGTKSETTVKRLCDQRRIPRWRASAKCRAVLQISVPDPSPQAKARLGRMYAMTTHAPSPAFVDSPAQQQAARERRRLLRQRYARNISARANTEVRR
jgi:hypothetical protein